jgi:S1-C subfamily serine protease
MVPGTRTVWLVGLTAVLGLVPAWAEAGRIRRGPGMTDPTPAGRDPLPDFGLGIDGELTRSGLRVTRVVPQGAAERGGVAVGEVIVAVNGVSLRRAADWIDVMSNNNGRFRLQVRDRRTGVLMYRDVDLG